MELDSEAVAERRDYVGGAALAIITTGAVVATIAANAYAFQFNAEAAEIGTARIVAVTTMCFGVALAGVMRLLSATTASTGQWLRRTPPAWLCWPQPL